MCACDCTACMHTYHHSYVIWSFGAALVSVIMLQCIVRCTSDDLWVSKISVNSCTKQMLQSATVAQQQVRYTHEMLVWKEKCHCPYLFVYISFHFHFFFSSLHRFRLTTTWIITKCGSIQRTNARTNKRTDGWTDDQNGKTGWLSLSLNYYSVYTIFFI